MEPPPAAPAPPVVPPPRSPIKEQEAPKIRLTISELPDLKVIMDAMRCQSCGDIGIPPVIECEVNGHLLCRQCLREILTKSGVSADSSLENLTIPVECPVVTLKDTSNAGTCGSELFKTDFQLYSKIFKASIMNCPLASFGCQERMAGMLVEEHVQRCLYNKTLACPFSDCGVTVRLTRFLEHLATNHGLAVMEGSETFQVKIYQERMKRGITNSTARASIQWVSALLRYGNHEFMLIVRDTGDHTLMWLHHIEQVKTADAKLAKSEELCVDNLVYRFQLKNEQKRLEEMWSGFIVPSDFPMNSTEPDDCLKMMTANLMKRYILLEEGAAGMPYWNIKVEFVK